MADGAPDTRSERFSTGRVFRRAFGTITANPLAGLGIALLFGALPSEAYQYVDLHFIESGLSLRSTLPRIAGNLGASIVTMVFATVAQGVFIRLTLAHEESRRPSFAEAGMTGVRTLLPLLGLGLVAALGTTIGLAMLLVPGVFLILMWAVAAPVLVEERCGIRAALRRSATLGEGSWGSIFAIGLVVGGIQVALVLLLPKLTGFSSEAALIRMVADPFPALYLSVQLLTSTLTATLSAAVFTSLYVELRNFKQGTPKDALAEIFA